VAINGITWMQSYLVIGWMGIAQLFHR
jgi:hypothetical protein